MCSLCLLLAAGRTDIMCTVTIAVHKLRSLSDSLRPEMTFLFSLENVVLGLSVVHI